MEVRATIVQMYMYTVYACVVKGHWLIVFVSTDPKKIQNHFVALDYVKDYLVVSSSIYPKQ